MIFQNRLKYDRVKLKYTSNSVILKYDCININIQEKDCFIY